MIPKLFTAFCDDAAMFPPGDAPADEAVVRHAEHRAAWYQELVGPLVVAADRTAEVVAASPGHRPKVVIVGREPLTGWDGLDVVGVEMAADDVNRAVATLDSRLPAGVTGTVEVARGDEKALDVLAAGPYRAKFRTGGVTAAAFPTERELAGMLVGAVARELPFKCTAGLHNAVRHTGAATGFEHHGFLNILAATWLAGTGADTEAVAGVLALRSGPELAAMMATLDPAEVARVRRSFLSYGTCSVTEPLDDLLALDLVPKP